MQSSLSSFMSDGRLFSVTTVVAVIAVLVILALWIWRSFVRRGVRVPGSTRTRGQRLGVVDAFDIDNERQLVLVRRDNVEHLILIGGPNDVLVESQIVRVESRQRNDKEMPAATGQETKAPVMPVAAMVPQPVREPEVSNNRVQSRVPTLQSLREAIPLPFSPPPVPMAAPNAAPPPAAAPVPAPIPAPVAAPSLAPKLPAAPVPAHEVATVAQNDGLSNALMEALGGVVPANESSAAPPPARPEFGAAPARRPSAPLPPVIEPAKPSGMRFQPLARTNLRPLQPAKPAVEPAPAAPETAPETVAISAPVEPKVPELAPPMPPTPPAIVPAAPKPAASEPAPLDSLEAEMARLLGRPISDK
ncbi:MAG: flagellar biosynthetic protein FliO [Hyphomicrobiales bacterium]|nr:flagellar biosynthetic protein FliO [Hyphomicrobiales bacterium]MDE2114840.1 flagellar biosynthetic protein FliO [Hyphomicrobiales bacterium]